MSKDRTWTAWSFRINDKAYKLVQPLTLEVKRGKKVVGTTGYLWWKKQQVEYTGDWYLVFTYNRGPATRTKKDYIKFNRESDARFWFNQTYESVFLNHRSVMPPLPPKKKPKPRKVQKKNPNLTLV